jgi:hypothetical protein
MPPPSQSRPQRRVHCIAIASRMRLADDRRWRIRWRDSHGQAPRNGHEGRATGREDLRNCERPSMARHLTGPPARQSHNNGRKGHRSHGWHVPQRHSLQSPTMPGWSQDPGPRTQDPAQLSCLTFLAAQDRVGVGVGKSCCYCVPLIPRVA